MSKFVDICWYLLMFLKKEDVLVVGLLLSLAEKKDLKNRNVRPWSSQKFAKSEKEAMTSPNLTCLQFLPSAIISLKWKTIKCSSSLDNIICKNNKQCSKSVFIRISPIYIHNIKVLSDPKIGTQTAASALPPTTHHPGKQRLYPTKTWAVWKGQWLLHWLQSLHLDHKWY